MRGLYLKPRCKLCKELATTVAEIPLCKQHTKEIEDLLEEVRLELLAEAELDQRNPAKVEAGGPNPPSETNGESAKGRLVGPEPTNVGSTPASPT